MFLPGSAKNRAVLPDGAGAYPAYETALILHGCRIVLPDGATLIRPTDHTSIGVGLFEVRAIEAVGFIERARRGFRDDHQTVPGVDNRDSKRQL